MTSYLLFLSQLFVAGCDMGDTVKPVLSGHSKRRPKIDFSDRLFLNAGQKYCRMLQWEHSAILLTFIKLPFAIKIFVSSILEWQIKTGFTVKYTLLSGGLIIIRAHPAISNCSHLLLKMYSGYKCK